MHPEKVRALRRMTAGELLEAGLRFIDRAREFKAAALLVHNPHWSEEQITRGVAQWVRDGMKARDLS